MKNLTVAFLIIGLPLLAVAQTMIGINGQDLTPSRAAALRLQDTSGTEITSVSPNWPASKAGLKEGDVIRTLNGQTVHDFAQLKMMLQQVPPGAITLGIWRDGKLIDVATETVAESAHAPEAPTAAQKCKEGSVNAALAATAFTLLACGVDLFLSGGGMCMSYLTATVSHAPTILAAGCAVSVVTNPQAGASVGISQAHLPID